jgi:hypothetical protein
VLPLEAQHLDPLAEPQREFWSGMALWLLSSAFADLMLSRFHEVIDARADVREGRLKIEAMLVQDYTTYALGPIPTARPK